MKKKPLFIFLSIWIAFILNAQQFQLASPDNTLTIEISVAEDISYLLKHKQDTVIYPSPISLVLENNVSGSRPVIKKHKTSTTNTVIQAPFYKRSLVTDHYNELILEFKGGFEVRFRAYNEGMAYRFVTTGKKRSGYWMKKLPSISVTTAKLLSLMSGVTPIPTKANSVTASKIYIPGNR